jgi:monoamine oxidase
MPLGAVFKIALVYDEPFWRADGLSGQSFSPGSPANLTIDSCTDTGNPGVLTVITEGPVARQIGKLSADERKKAVLDAVAERFGDKALSPVHHFEQNWAVERYSGGAMISHTHRACSPSSAQPCANPAAASTGPEPKPRPKCTGSSTEPCAPVSAPRPR